MAFLDMAGSSGRCGGGETGACVLAACSDWSLSVCGGEGGRGGGRKGEEEKAGKGEEREGGRICESDRTQMNVSNRI